MFRRSPRRQDIRGTAREGPILEEIPGTDVKVTLLQYQINQSAPPNGTYRVVISAEPASQGFGVRVGIRAQRTIRGQVNPIWKSIDLPVSVCISVLTPATSLPRGGGPPWMLNPYSDPELPN